MALLPANWDDTKQVARDPILVGTILVVLISLFLFIVWPIYKILSESFLSK